MNVTWSLCSFTQERGEGWDVQAGTFDVSSIDLIGRDWVLFERGDEASGVQELRKRESQRLEGVHDLRGFLHRELDEQSARHPDVPR